MPPTMRAAPITTPRRSITSSPPSTRRGEGKLQLDPQYLFGLRREVAELTRTWGAYALVSYGPVGVGARFVPGSANVQRRQQHAGRGR